LRAFPLADADKPLYHAGAAMASNFLVTLYRAAARLLEESNAPPEALVPLMQRTIENGFALTGPIARGDWTTVEAHLRALEERAPDLVPFYRALAGATRRGSCSARQGRCGRRWLPTAQAGRSGWCRPW